METKRRLVSSVIHTGPWPVLEQVVDYAVKHGVNILPSKENLQKTDSIINRKESCS